MNDKKAFASQDDLAEQTVSFTGIGRARWRQSAPGRLMRSRRDEAML